MARAVFRRLALVSCLVAVGCTSSPSQSSTGQASSAQPTHVTSAPDAMSACEPAEAETAVEHFLADLAGGDAAAAASRFAQSPDFRWYSDATRSGSTSFDRATLEDHLTSVAAGMSSVTISQFDYNGRTQVGNFGYVLTKTNTDGSTLKIPGKGAIDCSTGLLVVWSEGNPGASA